MNSINHDIHALIGIAFFFGLSAGLLISYLMVAIVYRWTASMRVAAMARLVAEAARQAAELKVVEAKLGQGRSELRELFDQVKVIRVSGSGVTH